MAFSLETEEPEVFLSKEEQEERDNLFRKITGENLSDFKKKKK